MRQFKIPVPESPHMKRISLSGTGADQTDYILKLNVHRGFPVGDIVGTDIFLNNGCKTDFSDVRFMDANGNMLDYYIQASGNYETIYDDSRLASQNVLYNGAIYAGSMFLQGGTFLGSPIGCWKSVDNGQTYQMISPAGATAGTDAHVVFIDSKGNIFAMRNTSLFQKSSDGGATWSTVIDMTKDTDGTTTINGYVDCGTMCEDLAGNLFAGRYQSAKSVVIYKSTDNGDTWTVCYGPDTASQHVHGIEVDPFSGYIYAGIDDAVAETNKKLIRSVDNGANWTTLITGSNADPTNFAFPSASLRFIAGGNNVSGVAVWSTTDDVTFTPVIYSLGSVQGMKILGSHIYISLTSMSNGTYSQLMRMDLDGTNAETIWCGPIDANSSSAFQGVREMTVAGTPTASMDRQLLVGAARDGTYKYKHMRIFEGGQHYQATFHVKLKTLPAAGADIYVIYGNPSAVSESTVTIYSNPGIEASPGPIGRWLLNEGAGTTINDSSGNDRHGILTHTAGKGAWDTTQGRRSGDTWPWIVQAGNSYTFTNGDYITIPTDAELEALTKFTILAWVKTTSTNTPQIVVSKGTSASNRYIALELRGSFMSPGSETGDGTTISHESVGSNKFNTNQYNLIGLSIDNSGANPVVKLIANARLFSANLAAAYTLSMANSGDLIIGGLSGGGKFTGNVCDVQLYDYCLSQLQVQQIYENRMCAATEPAVVTTLN